MDGYKPNNTTWKICIFNQENAVSKMLMPMEHQSGMTGIAEHQNVVFGNNTGSQRVVTLLNVVYLKKSN
jgi:hypothetical protein